MKNQDNLKAFPDPMRGAEQSFVNQSPEKLNSGMDLRDYFAAKAMQALVSKEGRYGFHNNQEDFEDLPMYAYSMADAMLKERNKQQL